MVSDEVGEPSGDDLESNAYVARLLKLVYLGPSSLLEVRDLREPHPADPLIQICACRHF